MWGGEIFKVTTQTVKSGISAVLLKRNPVVIEESLKETLKLLLKYIFMDFKIALNILLNHFHDHKIRYGLIGGFALGALGIPRATIDLDFLIHKDDLPKVNEIMEATGYECRYKSENVSQYVSLLKSLGYVDFLHAFKKSSVGMLERTKEFSLFDEKTKIKVLQPEDIIGLKVQAAANDSERLPQEYVDIEAIMERYGERLNWKLIEEYFKLFKEQERFKKLKDKYYNVK